MSDIREEPSHDDCTATIERFAPVTDEEEDGDDPELEPTGVTAERRYDAVGRLVSELWFDVDPWSDTSAPILWDRYLYDEQDTLVQVESFSAVQAFLWPEALYGTRYVATQVEGPTALAWTYEIGDFWLADETFEPTVTSLGTWTWAAEVLVAESWDFYADGEVDTVYTHETEWRDDDVWSHVLSSDDDLDGTADRVDGSIATGRFHAETEAWIDTPVGGVLEAQSLAELDENDVFTSRATFSREELIETCVYVYDGAVPQITTCEDVFTGVQSRSERTDGADGRAAELRYSVSEPTETDTGTSSEEFEVTTVDLYTWTCPDA